MQALPTLPFRAKKQGFSLVELSIVLAILGLLIGGVLSGKSLIHTSELRGIGKQYQFYLTAAANFKQQYGYLPGDFPNATPLWGKAGVGMTCGMYSESSNTATCDGNGDGKLVDFGGLSDGTGFGNASSTYAYETMDFYEHMSRAGLIPFLDLSVRTYPLINGYGWAIGYLDPIAAGNTSFFAGTYNNWIYVAPNKTTLTPTDAKYIDAKFDDGNPATGQIVPLCSSTAPAPLTLCTTAASNTDTNAEYLLDNSDNVSTVNIIWRDAL